MTPTVRPARRPSVVTTFGAHRGCSSMPGSSSSLGDQRLHVVGAPRDSGRNAAERPRRPGHPTPAGGSPAAPCRARPAQPTRLLAEARVSGPGRPRRRRRSRGRRPDRRLCGSGPPSRAMSTSSPVTLRTTSGPVTKIRPWSDRITTSVRAGPYAAPPAAGPSTTEICGTCPGGTGHGGEHGADRVQALDALRQPRAAGVPQADHRHALRERRVVARRTIAAQPAVPIAPPWTRGSLANATAAVAVDAADARPARRCRRAAVSSRSVPSSNSAASRASGSRAMPAAGRPARRRPPEPGSPGPGRAG